MDLTIAMEIDYFQYANRAEYFVPIIVKIPGREPGTRRNAAALNAHSSIW